jgi:hypothetical protein
MRNNCYFAALSLVKFKDKVAFGTQGKCREFSRIKEYSRRFRSAPLHFTSDFFKKIRSNIKILHILKVVVEKGYDVLISVYIIISLIFNRNDYNFFNFSATPLPGEVHE